MSPKEGVIKYKLDFTEQSPLESNRINELNTWRKILFSLKLIGQDPDRYNGDGFGNISCRSSTDDPSENLQFIISGTQTGKLPVLENYHYALVTKCLPLENKIFAQGQTKPSSEALTHHAIYQVNNDIQFVFHVHSPIIWHNADMFGIPATNKNIEYGTTEMAKAMQSIVKSNIKKNIKILCMKGHTDGVISYGCTADEAGNEIIKYLQ